MFENINIASANLITLLVSGGIITALTNLLKNKFSKYNPKLIVVALAVILGIIYQAFVNFIPADLQQSIVSFLAGSAAFAVAIYEFIWKAFKKTPVAPVEPNVVAPVEEEPNLPVEN